MYGGVLLEVGCSYGYNLAYMNRAFGLRCIGVEPSKEAVQYGMTLWDNKDITLLQGTSDELSMQDESVNIVVLGCCMCWVERRYLLRTISEADRVLKEGGLLCIYDFDTPYPLRRKNKHNRLVSTYKMDFTSLVSANPQYTLAEKRSFSSKGIGFSEEIQERYSLGVFYKEKLEDCYLYAEERE